MNRYLWHAYYSDGRVKSQLDTNPATGRELSSDHLPDQHLIKAIVLEPQYSNVPRVILQVRPGETFKRFWMQYMNTLSGDQSTCWVLQINTDPCVYGNFKPGENPCGHSSSVYTFVRPDGSIVVSTDPEGSEFQV